MSTAWTLPGLVGVLTVAACGGAEGSPPEPAGTTSGTTEVSTTHATEFSTSTSTSTSSGSGVVASTGPAPVPFVELGTGRLQWEPLGRPGEVELVAGPQGGWHVDLTLRATALDPDGLTLRYHAYNPGTRTSLSYETTATLSPDNVVWTDAGWDRVGDRVVFDIAAAAEVVNTTVCIAVDVHGDAFAGGDERCVLVVDVLP